MRLDARNHACSDFLVIDLGNRQVRDDGLVNALVREIVRELLNECFDERDERLRRFGGQVDDVVPKSLESPQAVVERREPLEKLDKSALHFGPS
jgi:hypothetical protein